MFDALQKRILASLERVDLVCEKAIRLLDNVDALVTNARSNGITIQIGPKVELRLDQPIGSIDPEALKPFGRS